MQFSIQPLYIPVWPKPPPPSLPPGCCHWKRGLAQWGPKLWDTHAHTPLLSLHFILAFDGFNGTYLFWAISGNRIFVGGHIFLQRGWGGEGRGGGVRWEVRALCRRTHTRTARGRTAVIPLVLSPLYTRTNRPLSFPCIFSPRRRGNYIPTWLGLDGGGGGEGKGEKKLWWHLFGLPRQEVSRLIGSAIIRCSTVLNRPHSCDIVQPTVIRHWCQDSIETECPER